MNKSKGYIPGDFKRNALIASFGNDRVSDIQSLVMAWEQYFELKTPNGYNAAAMKYYGFTQKLVDQRYKDLCADMDKQFKIALERSDGTFFVNLGQCISDGHVHFDKLRNLLLAKCGIVWGGPQKFKFATRELVKFMEERGIHIDPRQMNRMCDELGIERITKPGRPKRIRTS